MISVALLAASQLGPIRVLSLLQPYNDLMSYPVLFKGGEALLGIPAKRRMPPDKVLGEGGRRVIVSPGDTEVAVVVPGREIWILRCIDLSLVRRIVTPGLTDVGWSPTGSHLLFNTLASGTRVVGAHQGGASPVLKGAQAIVWSQDGRTVYASADSALPFGVAGTRWIACELATSRIRPATASEVVRGSWLRELPVATLRRISFPPGSVAVWETQGLFIPFYPTPSDGPIFDLFVTKKGPLSVRRTHIDVDGGSAQWWSNQTVWYLQPYVLFDSRESPRGTWWLGHTDLKTGKRGQVLLRSGDQLSPFQTAIAKG